MKTKILKMLKETEDFISGEMISNKLNMTRAGIWKHMKGLKEDGYIIESVPRKGYKLISSPDILTYEEIEEDLKTSFIGRNLYYYQVIDSTNKSAKDMAHEEEGTVLVAEEQSQGKGRLGRNWLSPKGKGIYMSLILKPNIEPIKVSRITLIGAAAVNKALSNLGVKSEIKWPNDILINGKKICGILTEMSGELNRVDYVIMGIGINVNLDEKHIIEELQDKATSIKIQEGKTINRKELMANILNELEDLYLEFIDRDNIEKSIDICRKNSAMIGKEVRVIRGKEVRKGRAIDINNQGELIVEFPTGKEKVYSGEVSIRGIDGYI